MEILLGIVVVAFILAVPLALVLIFIFMPWLAKRQAEEAYKRNPNDPRFKQ